MNISHFYAMLSRMRYINRWGLMNNTRCENLSEHSLDVAVIAHCLVLIHNKRFGGNLNAERAALLALFHDATEIITGDMPTPVKYFNPVHQVTNRRTEGTLFQTPRFRAYSCCELIFRLPLLPLKTRCCPFLFLQYIL